MFRTYTLQTLLALASAALTVSLLAAGAGERIAAPAPACPMVDSLLAGALAPAVPQPAPGATPPQGDA